MKTQYFKLVSGTKVNLTISHQSFLLQHTLFDDLYDFQPGGRGRERYTNILQFTKDEASSSN